MSAHPSDFTRVVPHDPIAGWCAVAVPQWRKLGRRVIETSPDATD